MPKSIEEVQAEYTRLCAQLGQNCLQLLAGASVIQKRVEALNAEHQELQEALKRNSEGKEKPVQPSVEAKSGDSDVPKEG